MILDGDGGYIQPQPGNPDIVFAAYHLGSIFRIDMKNKKSKDIKPKSGDKNNRYRFNFISPFIISHHNPYILYMTELSIYVSLDRGKRWHSLKCNLSTNAVYDLRIHPREKELMIGTHGRGVYLLPVTPIHQLSEIIEKPLHLFKIEPVNPDKKKIKRGEYIVVLKKGKYSARETLNVIQYQT